VVLKAGGVTGAPGDSVLREEDIGKRRGAPPGSSVLGRQAQASTLGSADAHPPSSRLRTVPCRDHAFDDCLVCRCGTSWWTHQLLPEWCPLDARGANRHVGEAEDGAQNGRRGSRRHA
jgi:hypothetical protein